MAKQTEVATLRQKKKFGPLQDGSKLGPRKMRQTGPMALDALEGVHKTIISLVGGPESQLDAPENVSNALNSIADVLGTVADAP